MVTYPNPPVHEVRDRHHLGDIWAAARAAGVQPQTIRVWVSREKIEPMPIPGEPLYHLPTVALASTAKAGRPRKTPTASQPAA